MDFFLSSNEIAFFFSNCNSFFFKYLRMIKSLIFSRGSSQRDFNIFQIQTQFSQININFKRNKFGIRESIFRYFDRCGERTLRKEQFMFFHFFKAHSRGLIHSIISTEIWWIFNNNNASLFSPN